MPELPEVETVRRGLEALVVGNRVASVTVTGARTVRRQPVDQLVSSLVGRRLTDARRRGKYLLVPLDDPAVLVIHLRMSGQLSYLGPSVAGSPLAAHTHARIAFENGSELRFVDQRTFGELFVTDHLDPSGVPTALARLGPDPILDGIDLDRLSRLSSSRRTSLKSFLLDQSVLAGIGNLYADEACFRARILPTRIVSSLTSAELVQLSSSIVSLLDQAIAARGSTLADGRYVDLLGSPGAFQHDHAVYGRAGQPCLSCGQPVERVRVAGRSTHFCASCQH